MKMTSHYFAKELSVSNFSLLFRLLNLNDIRAEGRQASVAQSDRSTKPFWKQKHILLS